MNVTVRVSPDVQLLVIGGKTMGLLTIGTGAVDAGVAAVIGPVFAVLKVLIDFPIIAAEVPAAVGHRFDGVRTL